MRTQQTKADISQKPEFTLANAPSSRRLGIQFFPVAAFAVICKPARAKPADKYREVGSSSITGTCCLDAKVGLGLAPEPAAEEGDVDGDILDGHAEPLGDQVARSLR